MLAWRGCCRRRASAQRLDLAGLVDARLTLDRHGANSGTKALTVVGARRAGGDSITDTAVLRADAREAVFGATRAPSTVGSCLRALRWHNVRQLDAVSRETLRRLFTPPAGSCAPPVGCAYGRPPAGPGRTTSRPP